MLVAAVTGTLLAAYGAIGDPGALAGGGFLGLVGVLVAQFGCVAAVRWGPVSASAAAPEAVRTGGVTGTLYGAEVLAEYLSPAVTGASVAIGWIIVTGLVTAGVTAAAVATIRLRSLRAGVTAAVYCAITEYLVWYPVVLACYYVFRTSAATDRVWRAEGTYEDFARSGASDIRVFVLQDFWGAGFFHLVAGLIIAGVFGTSTALAVRGAQRRRRPAPMPG
jgi:hypothetical protein